MMGRRKRKRIHNKEEKRGKEKIQECSRGKDSTFCPGLFYIEKDQDKWGVCGSMGGVCGTLKALKAGRIVGGWEGRAHQRLVILPCPSLPPRSLSSGQLSPSPSPLSSNPSMEKRTRILFLMRNMHSPLSPSAAYFTVTYRRERERDCVLSRVCICEWTAPQLKHTRNSDTIHPCLIFLDHFTDYSLGVYM